MRIFAPCFELLKATALRVTNGNTVAQRRKRELTSPGFLLTAAVPACTDKLVHGADATTVSGNPAPLQLFPVAPYRFATLRLCVQQLPLIVSSRQAFLFRSNATADARALRAPQKSKLPQNCRLRKKLLSLWQFCGCSV
jgi:hypothetical protein